MVLRAALVIAGFFAGQEAGPAGQTENEYALAARSLFKAGEYRKAAETCERGMQAFPNSEPIEAVYLALPAEVLAEGLAMWHERAQRNSDVTELITLGRVLSDLDPGRKTQAPAMAERLLARAIELAPVNPSAWYNYGRALRLRGKPDAMFAAWQKALSLNPDDKLKIQIYTHIARQKRANSPAEAEQAFRAALETNPRLPVSSGRRVRVFPVSEDAGAAGGRAAVVARDPPLGPAVSARAHGARQVLRRARAVGTGHRRQRVRVAL